MIKHDLKYIGFDDVEKTETLWFNINKAVLQKNVQEMMDRMENIKSLLEKSLEEELTNRDIEAVQDTLEYFIGLSYGLRDGDEFIQVLDDGRPVINRFRNTAAYSELVFDLMQTSGGAIRFIINVLPNDMLKEAVDQMKTENPEAAQALDVFQKTGKFPEGEDTPWHPDWPKQDVVASEVVETPAPSIEELEAQLKAAREAQTS